MAQYTSTHTGLQIDSAVEKMLNVNATTAELNTLRGITASTAELNYTDGVTSNIQTQLNSKQATISDLETIRSNASAGKTHAGVTTGNPHGVTKSDVGLGNVGNFKAVSTVASQGLSTTEKSNARANIGAVSSLSDLSVTATAAELNTLDGITASTTELNYVDGVTSNIQTQLNGKQATLTFNTAYNASTNKAATMADISSAIGEIEEALAAI